jgi:hypothetical protein
MIVEGGKLLAITGCNYARRPFSLAASSYRPDGRPCLPLVMYRDFAAGLRGLL